MDTAFSGCSENALKTLNKNEKAGTYNDDKYIYDYELIGYEGNFGIMNVVEISQGAMEVANERYFKQDSRLPGKNTSNEQRDDDRNNREIQDKGTMSRIPIMDSKTESRNDQGRNNVNKSETNNEELAQTNSFLKVKNKVEKT